MPAVEIIDNNTSNLYYIPPKRSTFIWIAGRYDQSNCLQSITVTKAINRMIAKHFNPIFLVHYTFEHFIHQIFNIHLNLNKCDERMNKCLPFSCQCYNSYARCSFELMNRNRNEKKFEETISIVQLCFDCVYAWPIYWDLSKFLRM